MENTDFLSINLMRLMRAKNYSQRRLAAEAEVSPHTVFRAVSKGIVPRGQNLHKIALALGVTASDLFANPNDSNANATRAKIKSQLDGQSPSEKQMLDFVFEVLEENKSMRVELNTLKTNLSVVPKEVLETWRHADQKVKAVCLFLLTGRQEDLQALPVAFRESMEKGFGFLGVTPKKNRKGSA